jgi:hypothetical protein
MVHDDLSLGYACCYYGYLSIFLWLLSLLYRLSMLYFIDHDITYILITSQTGEVEIAEYVCTNLFIDVFLAADPDYMPEKFE